MAAKLLRRAFAAGGRLFTWGENGRSLGYPTTTGSSYDTPKLVAMPEPVVKAEMGNNHSAFLTESGRIFVCGANKNGSLGLNKGDFSPVEPTEIEFFPKNGLKVVDVVCGDKHTVALTENGDVWSWGFGGRNLNFLMRIFMSSSGALGHGNNKHCFTPTPIQYFRKGKPIKSISGGRFFVNAVDSDGVIYNWGIGEYGVFGNGQNRNHKEPVPNSYQNYLKTPEGGGVDFEQIKSVYNYSVGQAKDGRILAWGSNEYGQIGIKNEIGVELYQTVNFMTEIEELKGLKIKDFYLTEDSTVYLLEDGRVLWAGMKIAYRPEELPLPPATKPIMVGGAYRCLVVVDEQNNLYLKNSFIKKGVADKATGITKVSGTQIFGGKVLAIGGKYRNCFAIVE